MNLLRKRAAPAVNASVVGDYSKLIKHRLIARAIRRDPALIERARVAHAHQAVQFDGWPFVAEWSALLDLPPAALADRVIRRDADMVRLRNSSPFFTADGVDFGSYEQRLRISRAARRLAQRHRSALSTTDISDIEIALMMSQRTPPEYDYNYEYEK